MEIGDQFVSIALISKARDKDLLRGRLLVLQRSLWPNSILCLDKSLADEYEAAPADLKNGKEVRLLTSKDVQCLTGTAFHCKCIFLPCTLFVTFSNIFCFRYSECHAVGEVGSRARL